jgi:hypothetical protein
MLTDKDRFRIAASDANFRNRILQISPGIAARCRQIAYFQKYKGPGCAYFKTGVKQLLLDMKRLGYKLVEGGTILSPEGDKLWPTTM